MQRQLFQWLVAGTLILTVGGEWAVLQSVAWVGMAVSYSQKTSFQEALQKTFDGQHPCKLCKVVEAGRKAEKHQQAQSPPVKFEFILAGQRLALYPPPLARVVPPLSATPAGWAEAPPTPPPNFA